MDTDISMESWPTERGGGNATMRAVGPSQAAPDAGPATAAAAAPRSDAAPVPTTSATAAAVSTPEVVVPAPAVPAPAASAGVTPRRSSPRSPGRGAPPALRGAHPAAAVAAVAATPATVAEPPKPPSPRLIAAPPPRQGGGDTNGHAARAFHQPVARTAKVATTCLLCHGNFGTPGGLGSHMRWCRRQNEATRILSGGNGLRGYEEAMAALEEGSGSGKTTTPRPTRKKKKPSAAPAAVAAAEGGEGNVQCQGCGRSFATAKEVRAHQRRRHDGTLRCIKKVRARASSSSSSFATPGGGGGGGGGAAPGSDVGGSGGSGLRRPRRRGRPRTRANIQDQHQYLCQYCRRNVTNGPRVHCVECKQATALCLECFASGHANPPHQATHAYRINFNRFDELLDDGWDINEELAFVAGLRGHGVGNWSAIGPVVGKKESQCRRHFEEVYLPQFLRTQVAAAASAASANTKTTAAAAAVAAAGSPPQPSGVGIDDAVAKRRRHSYGNGAVGTENDDDDDDDCGGGGGDDDDGDGFFKPPRLFKDLDGAARGGGGTGGGAFFGGAGSSGSSSDAGMGLATPASALGGEELGPEAEFGDAVLTAVPGGAGGTADGSAVVRPLAGFLPRRRDFAVAWDNADDELVGTIDVNSADRDVDKKLKLEILRSFHGVVRQRDAMAAFVVDRGLVDPVALAHRARAQPTPRLQLEMATAFAMRHLRPDEYERFVSGQLNEVLLQAELRALEAVRDRKSR